MIQNRINTIKQSLDNKSALLITSAPNRFYFTGFQSSDGLVLITKDKAYFLIDFRYFEKASRVVKSCDVIMLQNTGEDLFTLCDRHQIKNLFVETHIMSLHTRDVYQKLLPEVEISSDDIYDRIIGDMRSIKTADELALIKQAQDMTDRTFSYISERIEAGRSEREIMLDMEFYMRRLGSEGVSFDFIVVSGKNSSLPHGVPTDRKIEKGDFVTMDFGAVAGGYRSDMTRTVAVGFVCEEQRRVYDIVLKSQLCAIDAIKAGVVCSDIDKTARDIIYDEGFEGCFGHGLGHSVGIEIHEEPSFSPRCNKILQSGTVITVEPGIYIENKFGVRIEDMVYVTDDGCIDITHSKKDLIIL